jgi:hypothetical protein
VAPPYSSDLKVLPSYSTIPRQFVTEKLQDGSARKHKDDSVRPVLLPEHPHP